MTLRHVMVSGLSTICIKITIAFFFLSFHLSFQRIVLMSLDNLAQLTASLPHSQPSPEECNDMTRRAKEVVRLLEVLRRMGMPEADRIKMDSASVNSAATEDHRPPKRPWEDMAQGGPGESSFSEVSDRCNILCWALMEANAWRFQFPAAGDKEQTAAEKDMEIIRTKRATSTAGGNATAGQPKSKYRKRSVSIFLPFFPSMEIAILPSLPSCPERALTHFFVMIACNTTRQVSFLQHPRNP